MSASDCRDVKITVIVSPTAVTGEDCHPGVSMIFMVDESAPEIHPAPGSLEDDAVELAEEAAPANELSCAVATVDEQNMVECAGQADSDDKVKECASIFPAALCMVL